jgi:HD-like signal output (HDOD) protein
MAHVAEQTEMNDQRAATVLCLSKLPPYRPSALKLLNISSSMEAPVWEFEQAFKSDPALTADLLLVANSAQFGLRSQVSTIRHAITYLGLERVRSLASTIAFGYYVRNVPKADYLDGVWAHSIATATIAEAMGNVCGALGLYTAGLMHDIGRLGLLLYDAKKYQAALLQKFVDFQESAILERTLVGMTHCEAGDALGETWQLPDTLRQCMTSHHDECDGSYTPANLVRIACGLADALGFPEVEREDADLAPRLPERIKERPELRPERLREQVTTAIASLGR